MHSKDLIVDQSRKTQVVKDFRAVSPYIDRTILFETFVVKAIDLSDLSTFVVASNQCDAVRVAHLHTSQRESFVKIHTLRARRRRKVSTE